MKGTAFRELSYLPVPVASRENRQPAGLAHWRHPPARDSSAEADRLIGIRGWLLWKIITLWITCALFGLVACAVRSSTEASIACFFYALFAGVTAYMLQTKKTGAVMAAFVFSLLSGSIPWVIYFLVSRRVQYTYAGAGRRRKTSGDLCIRVLSTVPEFGRGIR